MMHRKGEPGAPPRKPVRVRRVDECRTLDELFRHCLPAFGGAYLRRVYQILDRAIGAGCPLTLSISGPVTVSGQHQAWLIPLLETGWVAYLSTTDAVCYHDGHRSLDAHTQRPDPRGADFTRRRGAARRKHHPRHRHGIRRGRAARPGPLSDRACLRRPEFQKKMTGTELRYRLGAVLRRAGAAETASTRGLARDLPSPGDPDLRGRAGRRQRLSELDEAVGHAQGRPDPGLRFRARSARRGVRGVRLPSLGPVREPGAARWPP